jgi:hypothetical protein
VCRDPGPSILLITFSGFGVDPAPQHRALNGEAPLQLLDTDVGARQVEDVLGRLEYGMVG